MAPKKVQIQNTYKYITCSNAIEFFKIVHKMFVHQLEPARKLYQHCIDINIYIYINMCVTIRLHTYIPSYSIKWQHQPWQSHWHLRKASFLCKEVHSLISHLPNTSTIYLIDISFKETIQSVSLKWVEDQQQPSPSSVFFTIFDFFFPENWQENSPTFPPSPYHHPTPPPHIHRLARARADAHSAHCDANSAWYNVGPAARWSDQRLSCHTWKTHQGSTWTMNYWLR